MVIKILCHYGRLGLIIKNMKKEVSKKNQVSANTPRKNKMATVEDLKEMHKNYHFTSEQLIEMQPKPKVKRQPYF